jgi:biopolymer transport protein ExbB
MFSLAEALILTAVGLVVAIPAVVAFNYFNRQVKAVLNQAASLKDLLIAYKD